MNTKIALIGVILILLTACGQQAIQTPVETIPVIIADTPIPVSSQVSTSTPASVSTSSGQVLSGEAEIEIEDFVFAPGTITITVGTTVKWGNKDNAPHTVTGDDGSWGSTQLNKGDEYFFTFTQVGTYPYHCSLHQAMTGSIVVVSP